MKLTTHRHWFGIRGLASSARERTKLLTTAYREAQVQLQDQHVAQLSHESATTEASPSFLPDERTVPTHYHIKPEFDVKRFINSTWQKQLGGFDLRGLEKGRSTAIDVTCLQLKTCLRHVQFSTSPLHLLASLHILSTLSKYATHGPLQNMAKETFNLLESFLLPLLNKLTASQFIRLLVCYARGSSLGKPSSEVLQLIPSCGPKVVLRGNAIDLALFLSSCSTLKVDPGERFWGGFNSPRLYYTVQNNIRPYEVMVYSRALMVFRRDTSALNQVLWNGATVYRLLMQIHPFEILNLFNACFKTKVHPLTAFGHDFWIAFQQPTVLETIFQKFSYHAKHSVHKLFGVFNPSSFDDSDSINPVNPIQFQPSPTFWKTLEQSPLRSHVIADPITLLAVLEVLRLPTFATRHVASSRFRHFDYTSSPRLQRGDVKLETSNVDQSTQIVERSVADINAGFAHYSEDGNWLRSMISDDFQAMLVSSGAMRVVFSDSANPSIIGNYLRILCATPLLSVLFTPQSSHGGYELMSHLNTCINQRADRYLFKSVTASPMWVVDSFTLVLYEILYHSGQTHKHHARQLLLQLVQDKVINICFANRFEPNTFAFWVGRLGRFPLPPEAVPEALKNKLEQSDSAFKLGKGTKRISEILSLTTASRRLQLNLSVSYWKGLWLCDRSQMVNDTEGLNQLRALMDDFGLDFSTFVAHKVKSTA